MPALTNILVLYSIAATILIVSLLLYPKAIQRYKDYKKQREIQDIQRRNAANARLIKTVREEVRKYLEELQK